MATYTTYDQVGQAEDVSDIISNISPTKTPFQSLIGTEKISARIHEWQEDELAAVTDNAEVEGFDAVDQVLTPTVMRSNNTQIFSKVIKVAETADVVRTYGRSKETAYQLAKKGAEAKRDLEHTLVGLDQSASIGDSSTPRRMASVYPQISADTTVDNGGASQDFTEELLLEAAQAVYDEGGEPNTLMIKPADSLKVADFAGSSGRNRDFGTGRKVVNVVDLYVSPFGEFRVVLNRFINSAEALLFNPSDWKLLTLRPWKRVPLAKVGDSERHMIVGEFSLKHVNQKATARITDLS